MEWDPSRFFGAAGSPSPYALLILNQPINESAFGVLSEHGAFRPIPGSMFALLRILLCSNSDYYLASFIICADGGANRLYDMMKKHGKEATNVGTPASLRLGVS